MNQNVESLLQKEVSRKEFLALLGTGFLAITGVSSLVKNFVSSLDNQGISFGFEQKKPKTSYGGRSRSGQNSILSV